MAPKLNLPLGYCLVSLHFNGTPVPNGATTTFGVSADPALLTPAQVGTVIKNALRASGAPFGGSSQAHGSGIIFQDVTVKAGPMDTGPEATVADGGAISGIAGTCVSPNTSYLVTKATLSGGRRGRGRMFLPGLASSNVGSNGQINAPAIDNLRTQWTAFFNAIAAGNVSMALLHNYDLAKQQVPQTPSLVTSVGVAGLVASQRNRLRR